MQSSNAWEVYMIRAQDGSLYTGIATDPVRRFEEHQSGRLGARFFRTSKPDAIVYREVCRDRSEALRREHEIKRMSRSLKLELIQSHDNT